MAKTVQDVLTLKEVRPQYLVEISAMLLEAERGNNYAKGALTRYERVLSSVENPKDIEYRTILESTIIRAAGKSKEIDQEYDNDYQDFLIAKKSKMKTLTQTYNSKTADIEEFGTEVRGLLEIGVPSATLGLGTAIAYGAPEGGLATLLAIFGIHKLLKGVERFRKRRLDGWYRQQQFQIDDEFHDDVHGIDTVASNKKFALFTVEETKLREAYEKIYKVVLEEPLSAKRFDKFIRIMKARSPREVREATVV